MGLVNCHFSTTGHTGNSRRRESPVERSDGARRGGGRAARGGGTRGGGTWGGPEVGSSVRRLVLGGAAGEGRGVTRRDRRRRVRVVVVGAGQAGLSVAFHLQRLGLRPGEEYVVLDGETAPGGAWRHRPAHLTLEAVHGIHALPGLPPPDGDPHAPTSEAVPRYFAAYEERFDLPVRRPVRVRAVREAVTGVDPGADRDGLLAVVADRDVWTCEVVVNATGTWHKAFWPAYPGRAEFRGRQLHSRDFRAAADFAGEHVVVVGGGTSAVEILLELAGVATTTWVTRRPPVFTTGEFTEEARRAAVARVAEAVAAGLPVPSVVSVTGLWVTDRVRAELESGVLTRLPMFTRLVPDGVAWDPGVAAAPPFVRTDTVIWATGYRAMLDHLAPLGLRAPGGGIVLAGTEVAADPRVHLVGYGPSASSVGANRAARAAARAVLTRLG